MNTNRVSQVNVEDEMRESYLSYAMSVIASRALPDVRDGFKPVQRRILYAMREMNMTPDKQHRKCAGVIGEVLKSYHPHGDSSVYDALVRMAQDFTLRYPLIDGHGNFGSIDGDPPAAYRYTEARLARIALEMLVDIDKDTVDFVPNFDNQGTEPVVLPGRLPQLLVNGSSGIAVGMATNIPPHNVAEICDAVTYVVDHEDEEADAVDEALAGIVTGPDFPTGGVVLGKEILRTAYKTGRGSVPMRGKAEIVEEKGKFKIVITEVPFQVTTERLKIAIVEAHHEKTIVGIQDVTDETNRKSGIRIVVDLQKTATPNVVLNQLYKHTPLQSSFGFNMLALVPVPTLVPGAIPSLEPQVLSLRQMLEHFVAHRKIVIRRRTEYDLMKARERAHILEGFRIALDNIDEVIKVIRESASTEAAREALMNRFELTLLQANAILDMRLRTLTSLERQKIEDEYLALLKTIAELEDILANPRRVSALIKSDCADIKKRFGDERRTIVMPLEDEFNVLDVIPDTPVVVTMTLGGYIKRVSVDTFRAQNRGGRGVIGIATKREDVVANFFTATTHQSILFFTNKGRAYRLPAYQIPDTTRQARGTALVNLLTLPPGENVTAIFPIREFSDNEYLVMVTRRGVIKKTPVIEFSNIRRNGLIAVGLDENDELLAVDLSEGNDNIILGTKDGMAVHFSEKDVRSMGRNARGVRAITLAEGDQVVAMDVEESERSEVLIVTSKGFGKRTPIADYRHTQRGGKGVKAFAKEKDIGSVVDQILVKPEDDIMLITANNQVIRMNVTEVRKLGRSTKGVKLQRLEAGDEVIAITNLGEQVKQIETITGEPLPDTNGGK